MATKRPTMPLVSGMSEGSTDKAERWLDTMIRSDEPVDDKDFEVTDTSMPSMLPTTSSNPERPRTLRAGYDYATQTMTVVFRDGVWWEYRGVPPELWHGFKAADSKGKFLRSSGLDSWQNMGPSELENMPTHRRVQMADLDRFIQYMYGRPRGKK